MPTKGELWLRNRGEVNHDWLKNQFGTALRAHRNSFRGLVTSPSLGRESLRRLMAEWDSRSSEIEILISSFEDALSPSVLFLEEPLRSVGFRPEFERSLQTLVHDLWKRRLSLPELVSTAMEKLAEARICATRLQDSLESRKDLSQQVLDILTAFLGSIRSLSEALSTFPRKVEVL